MLNFFTVVRDFLTDYLPMQKGLSENTIISYRQVLNLMVNYLRTERKMSVKKIGFETFNRELILEFLDWLETSRNCGTTTRNHRLMVLRSFFDYAGVLDCTQVALSLAVNDLPVKKAQGRIVDYLSEKALEALLAQPKQAKRKELRDLVFMMLMYDSAARCNEMLNLRVRDLRLATEHPTMYLLGKGNKPRIVPVMLRTVEHCKHYLDIFHSETAGRDDNFVFYTVMRGKRKPISADAVALFMSKYCGMAKVICPEMPDKLHPHMLRHTRAMHLYRSGMPLHLLSQTLGHASEEATRIYAFADTEMKREAMTKADALRGGNLPPPAVWEDDEDMILTLAGLR
ncbi:MAG: site-specific integrase [Clostridiales Family XIII bacterium]|jgi:site-specific recombinase XerD|nr:site-specific integrase [Clostridiales Family XIII bacterium]